MTSSEPEGKPRDDVDDVVSSGQDCPDEAVAEAPVLKKLSPAAQQGLYQYINELRDLHYRASTRSGYAASNRQRKKASWL